MPAVRRAGIAGVPGARFHAPHGIAAPALCRNDQTASI
jgi:hypothetical protein